LPPLLVKATADQRQRRQQALTWEFNIDKSWVCCADVNYGSTGYGRKEYRQRLDYQWGIVDVDDVNGAGVWLSGVRWIIGLRSLAAAGG